MAEKEEVVKNGETQLRLEIDKFKLDEELVGQPMQVFLWARKTADAQLEFDEAKAELSLSYAELDKSIRDNPADYGIAKLTETIVEQTILALPEYVVGQKRVNKARHKVAYAEAAVNGLEHRKRSITLLVELWIKEYYSDTRGRIQGSEEVSEFEKDAIRNRARRRIEEKEELATEDSET